MNDFESRQWYYVLSNKKNGPISWQTVIDKIKLKEIKQNTPIWSEGMDAWIEATKIIPQDVFYPPTPKNGPPPIPTFKSNKNDSKKLLIITSITILFVIILYIGYIYYKPQQLNIKNEQIVNENHDPLNMKALLIEAVKNGELTNNLMIKYNKKFKDGMANQVYVEWLEWEIENFNPKIESIENGTVDFKGRKLPASIIIGKFDAINRKKGEKRIDYVALAAANDSDFKMWRYINSWTEEKEAIIEIPKWKKSSSFISIDGKSISNEKQSESNINIKTIETILYYKEIGEKPEGINSNKILLDNKGYIYILNKKIEPKLSKEELFSISIKGYVNYNDYTLLFYEMSDGDNGWSGIVNIDNKNNLLKWHTELNGFNIGQGIIFNDNLFITSIGRIYNIDINTGKIVWSHDNLYETESGSFNSFKLPIIKNNIIEFKDSPYPETKKSKSVFVDINSGEIIKKQ